MATETTIPKPVKERDSLDLLELVCQLRGRSVNFPSKEIHNAYVEARTELESRLSKSQPVSSSVEDAAKEYLIDKGLDCPPDDKSGLWLQEKILDAVKYGATWQASQPSTATPDEQDYEPYFGWCNVEGCENEGCSGGNAWRETGYWTVCYKHSADYREGKPQPKMKQAAIDREASRGKDGCLPANAIKVGKK